MPREVKNCRRLQIIVRERVGKKILINRVNDCCLKQKERKRKVLTKKEEEEEEEKKGS